jgi:hypothetical protein
MSVQRKLNEHNQRHETQDQWIVLPLGFHKHLNIAQVCADAITCKTAKLTASNRKCFARADIAFCYSLFCPFGFK